MTKFSAGLAACILISSAFPAHPRANAKESKDSDFTTEQQEFQDIVNYGVSTKRIWLIKQIVHKKDKRHYPLINALFKRETQADVITALIHAIQTLKLHEYALHITKHINATDPKIQIASINAIGALKIRGFEDALKKILTKTDNRWLKRAVIKALGNLRAGAAQVLEDFYHSLADDTDSKLTILQSLGKIKNPTSIPFLTGLLKKSSQNSIIRAQAALSLGIIGTEQCIKALEAHVHDPDKKVAQSAIEALPASRYKSLYPQLLRNDRDEIRYKALEVMADNPPKESFPILQYMFKHDKSPKIRYKVIELLQVFGGSEVIELWHKHTQDTNIPIQRHIIQSLHKFPNTAQIRSILSQTLKSQDKATRELTIRKAIEIYRENSIKFFNTELFPNQGENTLSIKLYTITQTAQQLQEKAIPPLTTYLKHKNPHIRRYSYYHLLKLQKPQAYAAVFTHLPQEEDPELLQYLLKLFQKDKITESLPILHEKFLHSPNPEIRSLARTSIQQLQKLQSAA